MSNIQSAENKTTIINIASILKIALLCFVSGLLNMLLSHFLIGVCGLPLYLDTLFTAAVYFSAGLVPALITAVLLPVFTAFECILFMNLNIETVWGAYPFVLCVIIDYILTLLSAPKAFYPEDSFKLGLLRNNAPLLAASVFSRIPINIVDRFFVIFGGYGVSLVYRKILGK